MDLEKIAGDLQEAMLHAATSNVMPDDYERINARTHWLILEALKKAARSGEAVERDAARLDYLERRWMDGVHLEVCHKGGGDHPLSNAVMSVTLYVGSKEYAGDKVRAAIDAAMRSGVSVESK